MSSAAPPPPLAAALEELRRSARQRYGEAVLEPTPVPGGLRCSVALRTQGEEVRRLAQELWPAARCSVLVLSERPPRLLLEPRGEALQVWRRALPDGELTTQLVPGDPPAELLAVRGPRYLVRAPGQALGWVDRDARFGRRSGRLPARPEPAGWDPAAVLSRARSLLGRAYVFGGTGAPGVDCSGLVWRSYLSVGLLLPRNSRAQRRSGERVALGELAPADLVGAVHRAPGRSSHIALALDPRNVIHACRERGQVLAEPLDAFRERYQVVAVRRLPGARSR